MALPDFREIDVADAVNGRVGVINKPAALKYIHRIELGNWIGNRGTITGTPTVTKIPSNASAPTATVSNVGSTGFDLVVDTGVNDWDTDGQGALEIVTTFSNTEKHRLALDYKIT